MPHSQSSTKKVTVQDTQEGTFVLMKKGSEKRDLLQFSIVEGGGDAGKGVIQEPTQDTGGKGDQRLCSFGGTRRRHTALSGKQDRQRKGGGGGQSQMGGVGIRSIVDSHCIGPG